MTVPSRTAMLLIVFATGLCLLAPFHNAFVAVAIGLDLAVVALVLIEGRALRRLDLITTRSWERPPQANTEGTFVISIENRSNRAISIRVLHRWASPFEGEAISQRNSLARMRAARFTSAVVPKERGPAALPASIVEVSSGIGLARSRRVVAEPDKVDVGVSLKAISDYDRLARSRALGRVGIHRQRVVGIGREFEQIREYTPGDDFRDVNWKATARAGSPRTNMYRAERSRDLLICVDGGRLMTNPVGEQTALDHAVQAAVLLAHASRDAGDKVGLLTFRERVCSHLRPTNSAAHMQLLMKELAGFDARPVFTNYFSMYESIRRHQSHRALVFILTDLGDPQVAERLVQVTRLLAGRHMVVAVSLEDTSLEAQASGPAGTKQEVAGVLAARQLARERSEHTRRLVRNGAQVLVADAEGLSLGVINRYMSIKSRQLA